MYVLLILQAPYIFIVSNTHIDMDSEKPKQNVKNIDFSNTFLQYLSHLSQLNRIWQSDVCINTKQKQSGYFEDSLQAYKMLSSLF